MFFSTLINITQLQYKKKSKNPVRLPEGHIYKSMVDSRGCIYSFQENIQDVLHHIL